MTNPDDFASEQLEKIASCLPLLTDLQRKVVASVIAYAYAQGRHDACKFLVSDMIKGMS